MFDWLPIFSISGSSGSGKTTLIESLIPSILQMGIRVAVVKHESRGFRIDYDRKDGDPIFCAGADVLLYGKEKTLFQTHIKQEFSLDASFIGLITHYDLIIVEGYKQTSLPKFWLVKDDESVPCDVSGDVIASLSPKSLRKEIVLNFIRDWMPKQIRRNPVLGCVLIGGQSRRMGRPKHLIEENNQTWLEKTIYLLQQTTDKQVIVGKGKIPSTLSGITRLPDVPDVSGPMAGILSAMRWMPMVSWMVCACDMPNLQSAALEWILSFRKPGCWLVAAQKSGVPFPEPMPALYDFRMAPIIEQLSNQRIYQLSTIASHPKANIVTIPDELRLSWDNFNTPNDLERIGI